MKVFEYQTGEPYGKLPELPQKDHAALNRVLSAYNGKEVKVERAVVTGQQLGFMGGPLYTVLKGISCLREARRLNAAPIYWLASEDHDIGEIDHTYTLDALGNIQKHSISLPKEGYFVEDIRLTEKNREEIRAFLKGVGLDLPIAPSYAETMAGVLRHIFRGTELLFIEPKHLRALAAPFFEREIAGEANLFYKDEEGLRKKADAAFLKKVPVDRLSPNFKARPVFQSFVIPTIAYVAGPNEMRYYRELEALHAYHNIPMPKLLPRMQAVFVPGELYGVDALKPIPDNWSDLFPELQGLDKKEMKLEMEKRSIPYDALHRLRNLIHPKEKPQERVFNWLWLQSLTSEDLVQKLLA